MSSQPVCPGCANFIAADDSASYTSPHDGKYQDCSSCVYFSSRNCGTDTGLDKNIFGQEFI